MRKLSATVGDLRSLAFEHGAVPSAVVRLVRGRALVVLANARLAALAGGDLEGRWLDEAVAADAPLGRAELERAAASGDAITTTVRERTVEIGATALPLGRASSSRCMT